ncbi:hypothetical protein BDZ89DRAFT_1129037 [Hymenopellis radicata]|nr:hypothetical protein BDZ89DRAFT_1129037 [Hymenopellis radicata]
MNRPRESILSLFDPLHDGAISDDGEASDDYDSDKENSAPPAADMTMGTFFKSFKPTATSQPVVLRKRLVDVGDVTVDESYLASVSEDDEDEDEFDDENNFLPVEQTPRPAIIHGTLRPSPRTPFMELQSEHEATPVAAKRMLKRQLFPQRKGLTVAPTKPDGPLSSVVDFINAEGVSFSDSKLPKSPVPAITISSPDATPTTAEFPHSSETLPDDDGDDLESPTPRAPKAPGSLTDRLSLDLQASFQLHFDSPEASFDLLNDKISFFGHTSRDFGSTSGDEEELDLYNRNSGSDGEKTPPARTVCSDIPECKLSAERNTVLPTERHSSPLTTRPVSALSMDLPEEPKGPSPVNEPLVEQRQPAALFDEPQTDEEEAPIPIGRRDPLTTPVAPKSNQFPAPPPVQALRIIKRPKPALSAAAERPPDEKEKLVVKRPVRPSTSANEPHTALKPAVQSKPSVPVAVMSDGPRRMPVTVVESSDSSASKIVAPTKTLAGGGPRRFVVAEVNAQMRTQKVTLESVRDAINAIGKTASKAKPARQVSSAVPVKESGRSTSTVPRPVSSMSRLPAPTFGLNKAGRGAKPAPGITRRCV